MPLKGREKYEEMVDNAVACSAIHQKDVKLIGGEKKGIDNSFQYYVSGGCIFPLHPLGVKNTIFKSEVRPSVRHTRIVFFR